MSQTLTQGKAGNDNIGSLVGFLINTSQLETERMENQAIQKTFGDLSGKVIN